MRNTFNNDLLLISLGVIQPASVEEVLAFLKILFPEVDHWPGKDVAEARFFELRELRYLIEVRKGFYSLTLLANSRMDVKYKRLRDKIRLSLLRDVYDASLHRSEAGVQDLVGVSPTVDTSSNTKEGSRPISSGLESSHPEGTRLQTRTYWSRVSEQLSQVGLVSPASGPSPLQYYSFPTLKSLQEASGSIGPDKDMTLTQLALAIGVTPHLLSSFIHKPKNHYRFFSLPKKAGGYREIAAPRFFLKTVQYWIKSYFLHNLRVHDCCHAYRRGRSIQTNAGMHVGKKFVANLDIENFFGSISAEDIFNLLLSNDVGSNLARSISRLTTLDGVLPQGAPTSPVISNAFLCEFDKAVHEECIQHSVCYTRYADDITLSGDKRPDILCMIFYIEKLFLQKNLRLNQSKTRIASNKASQRVTGLVVNEKVLPPREYRREVRSIFHSAYCNPKAYVGRIDELSGHLSYLSSFDALKESKHLVSYRWVIKRLKLISQRAKEI